MDKEKQIEEMYKDVGEALMHNSVVNIVNGGFIGVNSEGMARELFDADYRKQSEVAREIFAEMRKQINGYENIDIILDRLEKKYLEGENEK